jgi:hypothetical protein
MGKKNLEAIEGNHNDRNKKKKSEGRGRFSKKVTIYYIKNSDKSLPCSFFKGNCSGEECSIYRDHIEQCRIGQLSFLYTLQNGIEKLAKLIENSKLD